MRYYLSLLTMLHNDARFLKEFLEYYLLVGVQHFYLYDHQSSDNTDEILKPYILKGLVTYTFVPDDVPKGTGIDTLLCKIYTEGVAAARNESKWLAIVDSDEFIVPKRSPSLATTLIPYEAAGGLAVNWQMFGTSGVHEVPAHQLMTQHLIKKASLRYDANKHVKVIVQPLRVERIAALHQAVYKDGFFTVDTAGKKVEGPFNPRCPLDVLQINHYFCRDGKYFTEVKLPRREVYGTPRHEVVQWEKDMNVVHDGCILRFLPLLQQRMSLNLFPLYYNWRYYLALYPDLGRAGIVTEAAAAKHWLAKGKREGRESTFDWRKYSRGVRNVRIDNEEKAISHWLGVVAAKKK